MSRVYFHSPHGQAELLGSERAYASCLTQNITTGLLELDRFRTADQLMPLVHPGHYLNSIDPGSPAWATSFRIAFHTDSGGFLTWRGHDLDPLTLTLNTAMLVGNDHVRLLARLHGQCELHGWVDGPNRQWLGDLIRAGLRSGLYRDGAGWDNIAALLGQRDDEPVVMSYSVTSGFPGPRAADWQPTLGDDGEPVRRDDWTEEFYELDDAEQWGRGVAWLRRQPGSLELTPHRFGSYRFGHGLTVLDLTVADWEMRLAARLGMPG